MRFMKKRDWIVRGTKEYDENVFYVAHTQDCIAIHWLKLSFTIKVHSFYCI